MKRLIFAVLILASYGWAQTPQCPVTITTYEPGFFGNRSGAFKPSGEHKLRLQVENTSGKDIVGVKYMSAMYDATNDLSGGPNMTSDRKIKAGKKTIDSFDDDFYYRTGREAGGVEVWVQKVVFADGTSWQDSYSGQHACTAVSHERTKRQ